jgi:hypothetical protein
MSAATLCLISLAVLAACSEYRTRNESILQPSAEEVQSGLNDGSTREPARQGIESTRRQIDLDLLRESSWGYSERVRALLDAGADVNATDGNGDTPLILSAFLGHTDTVRLLLDRGAAINVRNNVGNTALIEAASMNRTEILRLLLDRRADVGAVNISGLTAADAAQRENHWEVVALLKAGGVRVPSRSSAKRKADSGAGILWSAAGEADVGKMRDLVAVGADVNERSNGGWTPLMSAAFRGDAATVAFLLANRADPNLAEAKSGRTALILATMQGHSEVVRALLAGGADPNCKDKSGTTPMSVVQQSGHTHIGRLLKQAGARTPTYSQVVPQQ